MEGTSGVALASSAVNEAGAGWGATAFVRLYRDVANNRFVCVGKSAAGSDFGALALTSALYAPLASLDGAPLLDGDLWFVEILKSCGYT
jgi:hypothetical protein